QAGFDEMRRIIREEEPPRPSARISTRSRAATVVSTQRKTDPKRLSQFLRGDLGWIGMKALAKDRTRRYETASAFAGAVQRYLRHEPVEASPPSAIYRLKKFLRRHRGPVLAVSLLLLMLLLGVVGTTLGWFQAQAAQALAETNEGKALEAAAKER